MDLYPLKLRSLLLIFVLLSCFYCCRSDNNVNHYDYIAGFDISGDDRFIVYAFVHEGNFSIRRYDLVQKKDTILINESETHFYFRPSFSNDGKKVAYIEQERDSLFKSRLCIIGSNGTGRRYLDLPNGDITDLVFSGYSEEILFVMAMKYESYSPIAIRAFHDFDIYSIGLSGAPIKKLTNLNAYGMHSIIELDSTLIAFYLNGAKDESIYSLYKYPGKKIRKIIPRNDPRTRDMVSIDGPVYGSPSFCKKTGYLAFTNIYELFVMPFKERNARPIYFYNSQIQGVIFFNSGVKIIFTRNNETTFYLVKIEDKELEEIVIENVYKK